jgi:hypothetical protein
MSRKIKKDAVEERAVGQARKTRVRRWIERVGGKGQVEANDRREGGKRSMKSPSTKETGGSLLRV